VMVCGRVGFGLWVWAALDIFFIKYVLHIGTQAVTSVLIPFILNMIH
jgi:hypothetical protein